MLTIHRKHAGTLRITRSGIMAANGRVWTPGEK
jgi:hypothetical protein